MARIFISYSTSDPEPAARIKNWLEDNGFEAPFIDVDIAPGADWERELYHQLERSLAIILVVTPGWLASKWCFAEFTQARALGKPIFPVIETAAEGPLVAPEIQHLNLIRDRAGGLERLLGELERIRLDTQGGFPFLKNRSPYPGLRSFDEDDAAIYFGRDEEIRRLRELLRARRSQGGSRLIVILGSSGSGKSSLMRAGILPRMRREPEQWVLIGPFRPLDRPIDQLAISSAMALEQSKSFDQIRALLDAEDREGIDTLVRYLRLHAGQPNAFVVFAIDQGEELFSLADARERRRFLSILTRIAAGNQPALALMTYRSDFLGLLQSDTALECDFHDFKVNPLSPARIPEIIRGPAKVADLEVDDELVLRATQEASDMAALPLLAFTLSELYERHGKSGRLDLEQYQALGDAARGLNPLENAVRETADRIIDKNALSKDELSALRDAFIPALVRVDANGEYVRKSASWSQLPTAAAPLLESLLGARLLTATQRDGERVIEVSHEALLRDWPTLRGWLDEERELLLGKEQLQRDIADWRNAPPERRAQALLGGLKLSRARIWLAEQPGKLTEEERRFIRESIEAVDRAARQRAAMRRALVWGSLGSAGLLAIAAFFSAAQWKAAEAERDQAQAALLAVQSQNALRGKRIYEATKLAQQAMTTYPSAATRSVILQSLLNIPPALAQCGSFPTDYPRRVAWPPSTGSLLVATAGGQVVSVDRGSLDVTAVPAFSVTDATGILALGETSKGRIVLVRESGDAEYAAADGTGEEKRHMIRLGDWIIVADVLSEKGLFAFLAEGGSGATIARCDLDWGVGALETCELADGPRGSISVIRIDPSGEAVAFGTEDGDVFLQKTDAESEPLLAQVRGRVMSLAWDLTGRWLAVGSSTRDAGSVVVIDTTMGRAVAEAATGLDIRSLAWNADSSALAGTCGEQGMGICVWSHTETGLALSGELFGHRDTVQSIVWADGPLISMGLDKNILKWAPDQRSAILRSLDAPNPRTKLTDIDAAKNGRDMAVGTADGRVLVFDLEARSPVTILRSDFTERIAAVAWDRSARYVAACDDVGRVLIWEVHKPLPAYTFEIGNERIEAVAWDPGKDRVFAPLRDGRVASIEIHTGKVSYSKAIHRRGAAGLVISADGGFLVTSDTVGELIRWSANTLEVIDRLPPPEDVVGKTVSRGGLSISSDGGLLAAVGKDGRVLIYDMEAGKIAHVLETGALELQDVSYSADGKLIAVLTNDDRIHVWTTASNEPFATVNLKAVQTQHPSFWSNEDADWQAEEITWLMKEPTLAVSTSAGKSVLISFDDVAWSAKIDRLNE